MFNYQGDKPFNIRPVKKANLDKYQNFLKQYSIEAYLQGECNLAFGDLYVKNFVNPLDVFYVRVKKFMKYYRLHKKYKEKVIQILDEDFSKDYNSLELILQKKLYFSRTGHQGFEWREISSYDELKEIAQEQQHCILDYCLSLKDGNSRIFEIFKDGVKSHVQLSACEVVQHYAFKNSEPPRSHRQVLEKIIASL